MRKLNFNDLMNLMQISDLFNIQKAMEGMKVTKETTDSEREQIGQKLLINMLKNISNNEDRMKVYTFLSEPFEMDPEEVSKLPITELFKNLDEVASIDEWKNLFTQAQNIK